MSEPPKNFSTIASSGRNAMYRAIESSIAASVAGACFAQWIVVRSGAYPESP
jgi:hypothetical protein